MAKLYGEIAASALLTLDKSFARALGQPLDASEVYYSKSAAETYAASGTAYVGQKIVVIEDGVVSHWSIEDAVGTLKELGSKPVPDGTTIAVDKDGKITLANITDAQATGTYNAVLVNGVLTWVAPSSTTVEGLSDLIEALTGRVDNLEAAVGKAADGETAATGLFKAIADEEARAVAAEEALGERIDNITVPVAGVAADDKILSLTETLLSATVALAYDEENKAIKLTGKDGADLGSIDATPFIKDGMLEDVSYDEATNTITFKWNTAAGITEDTVVLSDIIEPYSAGNGLALEGNIFAIKLADGSEAFLTVSADGLKLSGVADAIATAKQEAIDAAATALETAQTEINGRLAVLEAYDHATYATKDELKTTDDKAVSNTTAIENLSTRIDGIVAGGGEPNLINSIKVNGVVQTIAEDKSVDITVPTKFSDLTDDSGFDARITAAQTQADKGVSDAQKAYDAAVAAQADADALETLTAEHTTKISALETTTGGHTTKIAALENADVEHKADYDALKLIVEGHTTSIASKADTTTVDAVSAKAAANEAAITTINETTIPAVQAEVAKKANSTDVYTKAEVTAITGTPTEGKTLVQMIEDAQTNATYDDSAIRALITAEEERATTAEQTNSDAIAKLTSDIGNIVNVMNFVGAKDAIPEDNTDYVTGDVIIVGNQEYVFDGAEWHAFGDASINGALISALDTRVTANENAIAAINDTQNGILATANAYAEALVAGIPPATAEHLGLVQVDNVTIQSIEGTISVKAVSTDLLTQGTQELILDGGSAGGASSTN